MPLPVYAGGVGTSIDPSSIIPPPVNDTGAVGTNTGYARADHTHVSSVFATIVATSDATGNISWSYPANFFRATPVIAATVEDASANAMDVKVTSNNLNGGTAKVIASAVLPTISLNLLGLNVFGGSVPVGTKVHIIARRMTGT